MNKSQLIKALSIKHSQPHGVVSLIIDGFCEIVGEKLIKGEDVLLVGFGVFKAHSRGACKGINPRTGEILYVPPSGIPKFVLSKVLKDKMAVGSDQKNTLN